MQQNLRIGGGQHTSSALWETLSATPNGAPSKIKFDSAETETDIKRKAYGPEFMDIFVDQAEQFSESELKLLKTSCRWPGTPRIDVSSDCSSILGARGGTAAPRVLRARIPRTRRRG